MLWGIPRAIVRRKRVLSDDEEGELTIGNPPLLSTPRFIASMS